MDMFDRMKLNCLSAWFPAVKAAGLPVPKTEIVTMSPGWNWGDLLDYADAGKAPPWFHAFLGNLGGACVALQADGCGWPLFLRTGQTSGKHDWLRTACLPSIDALPAHVAALVMYSTMVSMLGLPCDVWVVREMLPVKPICTLPRFGEMPLVPEVRGFVRGGKVECVHPSGQLRVARVVEGADQVRQLLSTLKGVCRYDEVTGFGGAPVTVADLPGRTLNPLRDPDFAGQFYKQLGLPLLDPQEGQQSLRYLGSVLTRRPPVDQWLAAGGAGLVGCGATAEEFHQRLDAAPVHLLDLHHRHEQRGLDSRGLPGFAMVDTERTVGVQEAGGVGQHHLSLLTYYSHVCTSGGERTLCIITPASSAAEICCIHPYWPDAAIEQGFGKDYCQRMPKAVSAAAAYAQVVPTTDVMEVWSLLNGAAAALKDLGDGYWSVDLLMTDRGWVLTDCALGVDSYHLPGCPRDRERQSAEEPAKPLSPLVAVPLDELVKS